jgi:hypothetical protein
MYVTVLEINFLLSAPMPVYRRLTPKEHRERAEMLRKTAKPHLRSNDAASIHIDLSQMQLSID